jgi:type I restriction enzyme S subunit
MMSSKRLASNNNQVPEGYKKTEVGVIPEDWNIQTVSDIAIVRGGKRLPKGISLNDIPNPYPYIRVADMYEGGINTNDIKYVPEHIAPLIKSYRIYSTDLFISVAGTLGIIGEVPETMNGANLTENADRITAISCNKKFLLYALISERIKNEIDSQRTIGAQPKLALRRIEDFKLAFPNSDEEQKAIAQTLSDVDALIAALDKLIAKKRNIKTATMQQLLTGKTRLPGFGGSWKTMLFLEIASCRKERIDPRKSGTQEFCVELEHIESGTGRLLGNTQTGDQSSLKAVFQPGDVLFGKLRSYLQKYWIADREGVCSTEIWVLAANARLVISKFLYQVITTEQFINAASNAYGTHMPRSDWNIVKNYKVAVPPLPEQNAIAQVLSDIDKEITALEKRRTKTQAIKQGMMQELLTGRTRLI